MQTYYFEEFDVWLNYPEEWKPIKDFEKLYKISNYGRLKSLAKSWICGKQKLIKTKKETIMKPFITHSYYSIILRKNNTYKHYKIHCLVYDHFGEYDRIKLGLQIDHKDNIKIHNWISNFQLLNNRENVSKGFLNKKTSSKYTGVIFIKKHNNWRSDIEINNTKYHLGIFTNELDAHIEYQRALKEFNETGDITVNTPAMKRKSSKYKYVSWNKSRKKWHTYTIKNNKKITIGFYKKEIDAYNAYNKYMGVTNV